MIGDDAGSGRWFVRRAWCRFWSAESGWSRVVADAPFVH